MAFQDHFSVLADRYTRFRPGYPRALFAYLAELPAQRRRSWDCGTGGGQAAVALAEFFDAVVGTDPSVSQIQHAQSHPRVQYLVSAAENVPLDDGSVDLISVAQALHWFEAGKFYDEVRRVASPGGIIAVWAYGLCAISPEVDAVLNHLYQDIVGEFWPPERRLVDQRYATIAFPFRRLPVPRFAMTAQWNLDDLMGYLETWSSVQKYRQRRDANPLSLVHRDLAAAWGPPETARHVTWPLYLHAGRVHAAESSVD